MNLAYAHSRPSQVRWRDITFTVRDGLRLYARHYAAVQPSGRRPAVCLPGVVQNAQEFEDLALVLSQAGPLSRDVYALDYRGRGRSDYDPDWRNYTPYFEMLDVLDFMALERLHDAALVGTSRGGIIAMIMGAVRPTLIGAVVLVDIGPRVESQGWMRLMGRVGRVPVPKSWDEAARFVRDLEKRDFPRLTDGMWDKVARQRYLDRGGQPAASYDPAISRAFSLTSIAAGVPAMWPQFRSLARVPVLVMRGENSDVLSADTVEEMRRLHSRLRSFIVPAQGHAPLLDDDVSTDAILAFLVEADGRAAADRDALKTFADTSRIPAPARGAWR